MSQKNPSLLEIEDLAALTPGRFKEHYGDRDKRLRQRRSRRVARKALAYAVGGSIAAFGGGYLLDQGLDQVDRDVKAETPTFVLPNLPSGEGTTNSGLDENGQIRRVSKLDSPDTDN